MIRDIHDVVSGTRLTADVCVVGAGAAGIAIAHEFLDTPWKVLVLESGGVRAESETQALYQSEIAALPHRGVHDGRARVFGGTTTLWGGQSLPFDGIDFEPRPWVAHSGWPVGLAELAEYYRRAVRVLRLRNAGYDERCWQRFGVSAPAFDPGKLHVVFSQWSPRPNFARAYGRELRAAGNVDVVLHANVVRVVPDPRAARIESVEARSLRGHRMEVQAAYFVLCMGGIETARLLLSSDEVEPSGIGNRHGLVGRYFQDHAAVRCGEIVPADRRALQRLFDTFYVGRTKYLPKLHATAELQRDERILNVLGNVVFDSAGHPGLRAVKDLCSVVVQGRAGGRAVWTVREVARGAGVIPRMVYRMVVQRRGFSAPDGPIYLEAHCEQEPNAESRVRLAEGRDALGMRRTCIEWRPTDLTWRTVSTFACTAAAEFERLGLGRVRITDGLLQQPPDWASALTDLNHHMGTTRMHDDPRRGVVDRHCRVHGFDNLYVAGGAVFPTSGSSNPTLTIIALALRIADAVKRLLRAATAGAGSSSTGRGGVMA